MKEKLTATGIFQERKGVLKIKGPLTAKDAEKAQRTQRDLIKSRKDARTRRRRNGHRNLRIYSRKARRVAEEITTSNSTRITRMTFGQHG